MDKQVSGEACIPELSENSRHMCDAGISSCSTCFINGDCTRQRAGAVGVLEREQELDVQAILDAGSEKLSGYKAMGNIVSSDLYSRSEVENLLCSSDSLDEVCSHYAEKYSNQLVWAYPFSDDMQGGGAIVPVREGFLFIPYSDQKRGYNMSGIELLDTNTVKTMKIECEAYFDGLFAALDDIETMLQGGNADYDR